MPRSADEFFRCQRGGRGDERLHGFSVCPLRRLCLQPSVSVIAPSSEGCVSRHHSVGWSMVPEIVTAAVTVFGPAVQVTVPTSVPSR